MGLDCTCPDRNEIPSDKRVEYFLPGAIVREGLEVKKDASKILVFHADCPAHGYEVVEEREIEHEQ